MKNILKSVGLMLLVGVVVVRPLAAQTNASLEAEPAVKASSDLEKQKLQLDKDLASVKLNAEKQMAISKSDDVRWMIHDVAWGAAVAVIVGSVLFFSYLKDKRRHETIQLMIQKGAPISPELLEGLRKRPAKARPAYDPRGYLCRGITLCLVGLAIAVPHGPVRPAGIIVLAIGAANLILWFIDKANSNGGQPK
jgi:hypothetical protein